MHAQIGWIEPFRQLAEVFIVRESQRSARWRRTSTCLSPVLASIRALGPRGGGAIAIVMTFAVIAAAFTPYSLEVIAFSAGSPEGDRIDVRPFTALSEEIAVEGSPSHVGSRRYAERVAHRAVCGGSAARTGSSRDCRN